MKYDVSDVCTVVNPCRFFLKLLVMYYLKVLCGPSARKPLVDFSFPIGNTLGPGAQEWASDSPWNDQFFLVWQLRGSKGFNLSPLRPKQTHSNSRET
jgi:hypothetical protein